MQEGTILSYLEGSRRRYNTNPDGSFTLEVTQGELELDEEAFKRDYEKYKQGFFDENLDGKVGGAAEGEDEDEEDEDEEGEEGGDVTEDKFQRAMLQYDELDKNIHFRVLEKELNIFKEDEEYNFVSDLKNAYAEHLEKSLSDKIFDTLPNHLFMDIKKPLQK